MATNLTRLEIEQPAAPLAVASHAAIVPASRSSAAAAGPASAAAPAAPAERAATAASKGAEPESLESPSSVVIQLDLGPVVCELNVCSGTNMADGTDV